MNALERPLTLLAVVAAHALLLLWVVSGLGETPPQIVPPTIQGVLIAGEVVAPPQPLPVAAQAPVPQPKTPQPLPEPKPKLKPKPPPKPPPPSERAITIPEPEPQPEQELAPEPEAPEIEAHEPTASAAEERRSADSEQGRTGTSSTEMSGAAGSDVAGEPGAVSQPRTDAAHLNNPAPVYPPISRRMGEEGTVLLDVHILPDGSVREVRLRTSSGHERLDRSALDAVGRWRYVPARRGDTPIAYWYVQPVVFSLSR